MDVEGLKRRTPSHVFEQWRAIRKMQRWGEDWDQTAQLTAVHFKGDKPISDFRPKYKPPVTETDSQKSIERTNALLNTVLAMNQARAKRGG